MVNVLLTLKVWHKLSQIALRKVAVRIPLDYYRILGVPNQATKEQLKQNYEDRSRQLPRREYSEVAIASRKKLLDLAYQILSTPEKRADYDAEFLQTSQSSIPQLELTEFPSSQESNNQNRDLTANNGVIEISPDLFIGALLILQELGEYELVLRLGPVYLNSPEILGAVERLDSQTNPRVKEEIILTIAIAYLELSREQWQQGEYENAAISGQMGQDLLLENNLFPSVQEVIEADLCKLRPYRILELVSQGRDDERRKGLQLLQDMLQKRQGIEGKGDDGSGLSFEHFLRYIQQLRSYLTSTEQEELFTAEAKRPSAVAAYLAVYTLLARGFAHKQPELIVQAQQILYSLSKRQDVYWEQAVCALLLGQTEQANEALAHSQEQETLELIRQYSQNSPDLLPGLCFYGEQWLQKEVMPQFSDLAQCKLNLKEYFGDRQVQAYLEHLAPVSQKQNYFSSTEVSNTTKAKSKLNNFFGWTKKGEEIETTTTVIGYSKAPKQELVGVGASQPLNVATTVGTNNNSNSISWQDLPKDSFSKSSTRTPGKQPSSALNRNRLTGKQPRQPTTSKELKTSFKKVNPSGKAHVRHPSRRKNPYGSLLKRGLLLLGLIFGVGSMAFVLTKYLLTPTQPQLAKEEQLIIKLNESLIKLPPKTPQTAEKKEALVKPKQSPQTNTDSTLNNLVAQQVVQKWLDGKAKAFGSEHQVDSLKTILTEPILSEWRDRAVKYQQSNSYRKYQHTLNIRSYTQDKQNPNKAVIEAQVKETAQHYQGTQLDQSQSYDDDLIVRYEIIRQGEQWLIQNISVVKTL